MEEFKVLITTSGLGSRLGTLTDYTNKSLVRVADKPAISYIIESYPTTVEFVITLGHHGSHVQQFLKLAYPNHKFTFVEVDKYKGPGSSLGYSILQCKHYINSSFIFHAADTLLKNYKVIPPSYNYVLGAFKQDNSQYRTLNICNENLVKINEKGAIGFDYSYIGVAGIKDYEYFFYELEKLIYNDYEDISDVHVINNMLTQSIFQTIKVDNWYDIGNTAELSKTRKSYDSSIEVLDKKDESIFFFDDFVIKFFANKEIASNRVKRAYHLTDLVPKMLSHTENFYKYKKVQGHLFSKSVNQDKFKKFLSWANDNLWIRKHSNIYQNCKEFYFDKTNKRINDYLLEFNDPTLINGMSLPPITDLINQIDPKWLCNGISSQFHGDFILDNVIETTDGFCLIDWRQDFAGELELGDVYYDLAKLNHNLTVNHDLVNKNLFGFNTNNCYILINSKLNECKDILHEFIVNNGYDLQRVKVLTSLIWINMAPLHEYPFNTFLFNFGKYNLYKELS